MLNFDVERGKYIAFDCLRGSYKINLKYKCEAVCSYVGYENENIKLRMIWNVWIFRVYGGSNRVIVFWRKFTANTRNKTDLLIIYNFFFLNERMKLVLQGAMTILV